jgi:ketosteroid isomerase-like protein
MSRPSLFLSALALSIAAVPPGHAATAKVTAAQARDIAAIRAVGEKWRTLYDEGRFAEIPELYTTDTMVMPRGRPRIVGREEMRKRIGGLAAGRSIDIEVTEREIHLAGDHGWFVGDFKVTYGAASSGAAPVTEYGRSLIIYRRDRDGQWRIHRDIDSPAPHLATAASTVAAAPAAKPVPAMWDPGSRTTVTDCDRMTASRYDRTRLAPPVARENMDVPKAIAQCEQDLLRFPGDPRITFQLGRIYGYAGDKEKTLRNRQASAAAGNHNAIFLLGYLDWTVAKDDTARCTAARDMKLAADRGNYSAQITYAAFFIEGRLTPCPDAATKAEVTAYLAAAKPVVDGFFETRLADHLIWAVASKP